MSVLFIILTALLSIVGVVLIGIILMQSKRANGLGNMGGMGTGPAQTYWNKNKGRSIEGQLEKYTKITATAFFILVFAINLIK